MPMSMFETMYQRKQLKSANDFSFELQECSVSNISMRHHTRLKHETETLQTTRNRHAELLSLKRLSEEFS